ncbi:hypothetical protein QBC36DRAFT_383063 [Triangularia setosa]|uniref:Uncharacterized protein n=1 Tax=Triangularia setosa TaxID=2587417 RepID=A0AAN6VW12_9PEZI|nr:hypothetical protein QBC36DRAFT_383063 [Podospora setosa]
MALCNTNPMDRGCSAVTDNMRFRSKNKTKKALSSTRPGTAYLVLSLRRGDHIAALGALLDCTRARLNSPQALNIAYLERENQQAKDLQWVFESTFAIVFLGTSHQGSANYADFGRDIARLAVLATGNNYNDNIIRNLTPNNELLTSLHTSFDIIYAYVAEKNQFESSTFQEGKAHTGVSGFRGKVVDGDSSELGHGCDRQDVLNRNHRDMCQFVSATDPVCNRSGEHVHEAVNENVDTHMGVNKSPDGDELFASTSSGNLSFHDTKSGKNAENNTDTKLEVKPKGNGHIYVLQFTRAWWMLRKAVCNQLDVSFDGVNEVKHHAPMTQKTFRKADIAHYCPLLDNTGRQATVMIEDNCWPLDRAKAAGKRDLHNFVDRDLGCPLLHFAVYNTGYSPLLAMAKLMLEHGADVTKIFDKKAVIERLSFDTVSKDIYEIYRLLLEHGSDPNSLDHCNQGRADS